MSHVANTMVREQVREIQDELPNNCMYCEADLLKYGSVNEGTWGATLCTKCNSVQVDVPEYDLDMDTLEDLEAYVCKN